MGNCLVTKLKGVVENDNLPFYGSFIIGCHGDDGYGFNGHIYVRQNGCSLKIIGNGVFESNNEKYIDLIVNENNYWSVINFDANTKVVVTDNYSLSHITIGENSVVDCIDLKWRKQLISFTTYNEHSYLIGDFSNISDLPLLNACNAQAIANAESSRIPSGSWSGLSSSTVMRTLNIMNRENITGDLTDIAACPLQLLNVWGSWGIEGSVESYIEARRRLVPEEQGTGTMQFMCWSRKITYEGQLIQPTQLSAYTLSWAPTTITMTLNEQ